MAVLHPLQSPVAGLGQDAPERGADLAFADLKLVLADGAGFHGDCLDHAAA